LVLASVAFFKKERNKRRKIMLEQKEQEIKVVIYLKDP